MMQIYADEDFYINEFLLGRTALIPPGEFSFWARRASTYINTSTFDRIEDGDVSGAIKLCTCELAELFYFQEQAGSLSAKKSESVGEYSVSYADQVLDAGEQNINARAILTQYLGNTGLLYRGVR